MSKDGENKVAVELTAREVGHVLAGLHLVVLALKHALRGVAWADIVEVCTDRGRSKLLDDGEIDDLRERVKAAPPAPGAPLPKEVADRLHRWGGRDDLFSDFEDAFLNVYDQDGFAFGERYFYDPETRKTYQSWLKLEIDEVEPPDDDSCPECGEGLADATDIPDDAICDACGWSRSGVRRCIRCGTRDPERLQPDDAVCKRCRAPGPGREEGG
jgi:hypothetical protein